VNRADLKHLAASDPDKLIDMLLHAQDGWQTAVDERNRSQRSQGSHTRPKKRGQVDRRSFEHATKDTGKLAIAGGGVFATAVGSQVIDKISSGEINILTILESAIDASGEWGMMIVALLGAYFVVLLAIKALATYP